MCAKPSTAGTCGPPPTSSEAAAQTTASWTSGPGSSRRAVTGPKAAASPDNLAGHPGVFSTVGPPWDNVLFYEQVNYAASYAFQRVSGDEQAFGDALRSRG